jgi:FAD/FMN-containing dehydrogenase
MGHAMDAAGATLLRRRSVLQAGATTAVAVALGTTACTADRTRVTRLASTAAAGGPSGADWHALAASLDGDLVRPADSDYDSARRLFNPRFDGIRPAAVVEAANPDDIAEAIRFARKFDLVARPRSGGHSYVGVSTAASGIILDVGRMRGVDYDAGSKTAVVRAGSRLFDVHEALEAHNRSVPTGTCPTVGAAGLTLGGGVGVEGRANGLTCDALQALTLVTAAGTILQVDANHHPDLFWAHRGGGGGNFGVMTSMRMRTFAAHRMGFYFVSWSPSQAVSVIRGWQRRVSRMPRSAWANVHLEAASDGSVAIRVVGVSLTGDGGPEAHALIKAVGHQPTSLSTFSRSHEDGIKLLAGCSTRSDQQCHLPPRGNLSREAFAAGSDVLGGPLTTAQASRLVAAVRLRAGSGGSVAVILDPLGGAVADLSPATTAFRWRHALATVQWYIGLPEHPTGSQVRQAYHWINNSGHPALHGASVGAYVNYLEPGRSVGSYYGRNLGRLRKVKARYDPSGFFRSRYTV